MGKEEKKVAENPFSGFSLLKGDLVPTQEVETLEDIEVEIPAVDIPAKVATKANKPTEEPQDDEVEEEETEDEVEAGEDPLTDPDNIEEDPKEEIPAEFSFKPLVEHLASKLNLTFDAEKFVDSEEGIETVIDNTIASGIQKYKSSLGEDFHKMAEFIEAGGTAKQFMDVYYGSYSFEDIDLESEEDQKFAVKEYLKLQDETDSEIEELLKKYEDTGMLKDEATRAVKRLKKEEEKHKTGLIEAQKEFQKQQTAAGEQYWNSMKEDLFKKEDLNGFRLTPKIKEQVWEHISKVDKKTGKTKLQENNETRKDAQFLYAYLDLMNFDISKLEKEVKTKVTSDLRKNLGKFTDSRQKVKTGKTHVQNEQGNPFELFKQMK